MVFSQKGAQKSNVGNSSVSAVRSSFLSITAEERGLCLASRFFWMVLAEFSIGKLIGEYYLLHLEYHIFTGPGWPWHCVHPQFRPEESILESPATHSCVKLTSKIGRHHAFGRVSEESRKVALSEGLYPRLGTKFVPVFIDITNFLPLP